MILRYIPNALSLFRLILIAPFLVYLYQQQYDYAFYIFMVAGFSDGLDGWLARHFNWQSLLGSMLDPIADKLLVLCSFVSLGLIGTLPWWLVILVISRDLTISFGALAWFMLIQRRLDFEPTKLSKLNTCFQLALVILCLFGLAYFEFPTSVYYSLIALTTFTTTASYLDYVWTWGKKAWLIKHPK